MSDLRVRILAAVLVVGGCVGAMAQVAGGAAAAPAKEVLLTKEQQAKLLLQIEPTLQFASADTGLVEKRAVKGRFVSRDVVAVELRKKFEEDESTKRMQRSELVMKKFGMLDRDFKLMPFMLSLLTEQIAGFYDNKTRQMTLLDWVPVEEQMPVMAHELTHALQDQRVGLSKWGDTEVKGLAKTVAEDNAHIAVDEQDTARDAVVEGQAMVAFLDYALKGRGTTVAEHPEIAEMAANGSADTSKSPVLERAPLVLAQSLVFPYDEGLLFAAQVLAKTDKARAFGGVLDAPPTSTMEILHPEAYMAHASVPVIRLPDLHATLDAGGWMPYDVGQMGELDVRMVTELFGGRPLADAVAPNWDGGSYLAAQKKSMAGSGSTASLGLVYESRWKNEDSARSFWTVYNTDLPRRYEGLTRRQADEKSDDERVYGTREGDVVLSLRGTKVFVGEGFSVAEARAMRDAIEGGMGVGPMKEARGVVPRELMGGLAGWMGGFGVMRVFFDSRQ